MRALFGILIICGLAACNLTTATPTPAPTPDIPTVEILAPPNNSQVYEGVDFTIDIIGRDDGAGVARIALYVDGEEINAATPEVAPTVPQLRVEMNWLARGVGLHSIAAVAYRLDGTASDEAILTIEVLPRP